MRIQHNIMAMNSYRNYTANNADLSKNLEKLSSGYKINRAGDDAAGLAISEKMRAQITGLETAQSNAQSGINLVQTAEGALTEVHEMLNRMVELADQSANGTYDDSTDRANLQKEFEALSSEIDRIADASNFNGLKLLDGSLGSAKSGAVDGVATTVAGSTVATTAATASKISATATAGTAGANTLTLSYTAADGTAKTVNVNYTATADANTNAAAMRTALAGNSEIAALFDVTGDDAAVVLTAKDAGLTKTTQLTSIVGGTNSGMASTNATAGTDSSSKITLGADMAAGDTITLNGKTYTMAAAADADKREFSTAAELIAQTAADGIKTTAAAITSGTVLSFQYDPTATGTGLTLQIGDTSQSYNQINVSIADMHTTSMGLSGLSITTQASAATAVDLINKAIDTVSATRGDLGATQNRLEHTINNLSVMTENIQDAEASIRDVDVAEEMMEYTKNNILVQSAQAMLAQANQVPQGVLQLLQ